MASPLRTLSIFAKRTCYSPSKAQSFQPYAGVASAAIIRHREALNTFTPSNVNTGIPSYKSSISNKRLNFPTRYITKGKPTLGDIRTNENLVAAIMERFPSGISADEVEVRMVMEIQGKSQSEVVSLKKAIQTAVETDKDLIEVAIGQEIPVVKVIALASLEYKNRKQKTTAVALPLKEVQLKAGIAENDLLRKVDQIIGYLAKGHKCKVRVRGTRRVLNSNPNAVVDTIEDVLNIVKDEEAGTTVKPPEYNAQKTQVQVLLQGLSKKKK